MFTTDRILVRIILLFISVIVSFCLCNYYGRVEKKRVIVRMEEMLQEGILTGTFWKIINNENSTILVTKYGYKLILQGEFKNGWNPGDKISFMAQKRGFDKAFSLWYPEKIHFHGNSLIKYFVSGLGILFVAFMSYKYIYFETKTISLKLREG